MTTYDVHFPRIGARVKDRTEQIVVAGDPHDPGWIDRMLAEIRRVAMKHLGSRDVVVCADASYDGTGEGTVNGGRFGLFTFAPAAGEVVEGSG